MERKTEHAASAVAPQTRLALRAPLLPWWIVNFSAIALLWSQIAEAQVRLAWVSRYNGPANKYDQASAMRVDDNGNVYVTGYSTGANGSDYATVKYDTTGRQLWVARYDGSAHFDDFATALAIDTNRNVYVSGASFKRGDTYLTVVTIRYDANGNELWARRFDGSPAPFYGSLIALDNSGNAYVTGITVLSNQSYYAVVKYDPGGNQVWVANGPAPAGEGGGPHAIVVDDSTNIYVSGSDNGGNANAILKFDHDGNLMWTRSVSRPNTLEAAAVAVDRNGNVYATGFGFIVKYNTDGDQLWVTPALIGTSPYFCRAIALNEAGEVYVAGSVDPNTVDEDYITAKYAADGVGLWEARYDGPGHQQDGGAWGLALDQAGNAYVTGFSTISTNGSQVYTTIKYDAAGNPAWSIDYNGEFEGYDLGRSIGLDAAGNVYVAGSSAGVDFVNDYATVKYVQGPVLLPPTELLNGQFQFKLFGELGRNYEIQHSADLRTWTTLTNLVNAPGTNLITDAVSTSMRFYRAVQRP